MTTVIKESNMWLVKTESGRVLGRYNLKTQALKKQEMYEKSRQIKKRFY